MPKVSDEHKAAVRERLLDAAAACLHEKGADALTTREVLERAGLSAGTLYHYFSGKDDLVVALAERLAATELAPMAATGDLVGLVRRVLGPGMDSLMPELRVRAKTDAHVRRSLARYDELVVETFAPLVEQAQAAGRLPADLDPAAAVELVELLFEAVQAHAAAGTFVTSQARVTAAFLTLLSLHQGALA
jgi:AcrR family transcriptional regulator